ncbi:MAG: hypothetical protein QW478_04135 [Candidatus Micrarchaeaceae archaeon]
MKIGLLIPTKHLEISIFSIPLIIALASLGELHIDVEAMSGISWARTKLLERNMDKDVVVFMDSDIGVDISIEEVQRIVNKVLNEDCTVTIPASNRADQLYIEGDVKDLKVGEYYPVKRTGFWVVFMKPRKYDFHDEQKKGEDMIFYEEDPRKHYIYVPRKTYHLATHKIIADFFSGMLRDEKI